MKKTNKRGHVFTLLLRNYMFLTLLLMALLTALFAGLVYNMGRIVSGIDPSRIAAYDSLLAEQRYGDFPIESLLGRGSGIRVLDAQQQFVYQAGEMLPLDNVSAADLVCIPDFAAAPEIARHTFVNAEGERQTAISMQEKRDGQESFRTYILDECGRILYQPGDLPMDTLTQRQMLLLSDSFSETHSIRKHAFRTDAGETCTLLLMGDPARPETADTLARSVIGFALAFLLIFCAVTLGFVLILNQKINRPLRLLHQELNRFERGEIPQTDYHGPKEFVEIFESFDDMAQRLRCSEEARRKLEAERQKMLADISHDLRTPIAVVQGYAAALRDGVIPPDQQGQYLSIIERKASGLSELINTFYEYSQMEHPDYALKLTPGDICNVLRDYVADRYAELEVAGFAVDVDIPEEHILCGMDVSALRRALDNIVNNAIRHNPSGTTLSFSLMQEGNQVRILLADDGEGIPAELRPNIFAPFVVGEASRSKHGSGLGLSIAKKIIETHHGSIALVDADGTVFEIWLPVI